MLRQLNERFRRERKLIISGLVSSLLLSGDVKTKEADSVFWSNLKESIYLSINPYDYGDLDSDIYKRGILDRIKKKFFELKTSFETAEHFILKGVTDPMELRLRQNRLDAFRVYLERPQKYKTFSLSEYKPTYSKEDIDYYRINNFLELYRMNCVKDASRGFVQPVDDEQTIKFMYERALVNSNEKGRAIFKDVYSDVMGKFTFSTGEDKKGKYVAYWDRWDLDGNTLEGENGLLGKPFELYDRFYLPK